MCAKLGEQSLGENTLAEPSELILTDDDVGKRAEDVMKSAFPTDSGTTWSKILDVLLHEFRVEHAIATDIINNRYIDSATGAQLDKLGELWQAERHQGESDENYRARIKTMFPRHTSRSTIDEIVQTTALLLQCDPGRIELVENFWYEPARFDIHIEQAVFNEAEIDNDTLETLLEDIKAAGVRVVTVIGKQFTHRSLNTDEGLASYGDDYGDDYGGGITYSEDYGAEYGGGDSLGENDPEMGYGSLDDELLGGEYVDFVTRQFTKRGELRLVATQMRGSAELSRDLTDPTLGDPLATIITYVDATATTTATATVSANASLV